MTFFNYSNLGLSRPLTINVDILPFRGKEPSFQEQLQNFEVAASKFNIDPQLTSTTAKGLCENLEKKCHGIILFLPQMLKIAMGFFVQFFGLACTSR